MKKPFDIEYTLQIWQEGDQYVAHAMPLDVMSSGATPTKARNALDEAVKLLLLTAEDMGTIEEIVEEAGYVLERGKCKSPAWISVEKHHIAIGA
jgi:predicted RNase H-like HicB family nuclease